MQTRVDSAETDAAAWRQAVADRFAEADWDRVVADVRPFLEQPGDVAHKLGHLIIHGSSYVGVIGDRDHAEPSALQDPIAGDGVEILQVPLEAMRSLESEAAAPSSWEPRTGTSGMAAGAAGWPVARANSNLY